MIRTPERELAATALLAAAEAIGAAGAPRDPVERAGWAADGDGFARAGVLHPLEGLQGVHPGSLDPASARRAAEAARAAALDPALLGRAHMALSPRGVKHARGQYYTPPWAVERVLDSAGYPGDADRTLLDPMCGAGAFLMAALRRLAAARPGLDAGGLAARVHGMDNDPLAVLLARAGCLITLARVRADLREAPPRVEVACRDPLLGEGAPRAYDTIAGNPPWVSWDALPASWRRATDPLWRRHGLFAEDGRRGDMQAVLGRGRKDLSMLATCVAADGWLAPGGTLSFLVTRSLLKSVGSGAGFRRFVLPGGVPLRVIEVLDLGKKVFPGIAARPVVLTLRKGEPTRFPVPWRDGARSLLAEPVDPADPGSAWLTAPAPRLASLRRILGPSPYQAHAGAYTGGANGVYWMTRRAAGEARDRAGRPVEVSNQAAAGKRAVPVMTARLEPELLYPLVRAADVERFTARPSGWILLPQDPVRRQGIDPDTMRRRYPRALAYLEAMAGPLGERRDRGTRALIRGGAPFWTMFGVSRDTLAPWKVVWPRIAARLGAAVAGPRADGRPVIPQETCTLIACRDGLEAAYLAGLLNGSLCQEAAAAFADTGGKSFGGPHLLRHIAVPRFDPHRVEHVDLAQAVIASGTALAQQDLDLLAARAWGI